MASVGVRDLRQRASELLRRVEAGETIEITNRGRPVALLSPIPEGGLYERMLASDEIERAKLDFDDLHKPCQLEPCVELPSVTLARLREHERYGGLPPLVCDRQTRGS
jgi:prevent-host-death family protein